jgi:hypothetical protein
VPLCPPQIPHDLTWDRTRAAAVGSQRLTAWAVARLVNAVTLIFYESSLWMKPFLHNAKYDNSGFYLSAPYDKLSPLSAPSNLDELRHFCLTFVASAGYHGGSDVDV